jgi:antitoxin component of MazEF toxin-antitoxin module
MSRRKLEDQNIRKLTKVGGTSLSVTIPVGMLRKLKWREKQKVVVKLRGKTITIKDWPIRQAQSKKK